MELNTAYGRKYTLQIGTPKVTTIVDDKYVVPFTTTLYPWINTNGFTPSGKHVQVERIEGGEIIEESNARTIDDLHIVAKVKVGKVNTGSTSHSCIVEIYNLSVVTQNFIKRGDLVHLSAGYETEDEIPFIFKGSVDAKTVEKKGADVITKLYCEAAAVVKRDVKFSQTYHKGLTVREVIKSAMALIALNGLPTGGFFEPSTANLRASKILDLEIPRSLSLEGSIVEQFKTFCTNYEYRAYIYDGSLYVEPIGIVNPAGTVILTEDNIKSIGQEIDNSIGSSKDVAVALKIKTFLNGRIRPNVKLNLNIRDTVLRGTYTISSLEHKMSFEGNDWDTIISCIKEQ